MIDEKKIINEIKTGGGNAQNKSFGILYDFYYPELFHFIYRYLKSADLAREIAHDAFVRLWLHRQNLDPDRSVRAYLFTICRNSLICSIVIITIPFPGSNPSRHIPQR